MNLRITAVIFDMDGVLIESEYLWRRAMIAGFNEWGMALTEDDCRKTMGMRFNEVIRLWLKHFQLESSLAPQIEIRVIALLLEYIDEEGTFIEGIPELIHWCKANHMKLGLATSSSHQLMEAVLKKLQLSVTFDALCSAEFLKYAKPHPEVFLNCAEKLGLEASSCMVIEDSLNGVISAKAAQMQVVAVPDDAHADLRGFALADYQFKKMDEVLKNTSK